MPDNRDHYHSSDRFPPRDSLLWMNSLERVTQVIADYTVLNEDDYLIVDTTADDITITLPTPLNGRKLVIANFAGINDVILTSTVNINNSASDSIIPPGYTMTTKDIGGEWLVW